MSEEQKPVPCSCCGEMPEEHKRDLHPGPVGSNIHKYYCCTTLTCPVFLMTRNTLLSLGRWNEAHDRMLELQRKAFEAGYAQGNRHGLLMIESDLKIEFADYLAQRSAK